MALSLDHLQLLTATCTAFLRLAIFFTSDDEAAQAARAELDDTEPFYANLHVELKSLCETLSDWDPAVAVPDVVLTRVLDVLESRFIDRSKKKYGNLQDLRRRIAPVPDGDPVLDIYDLRQRIKLKHSRMDYRKHMVNRFVECNTELGKLARKSKPLKVKSTLSPLNIREKKSSLAAFKVREHAKHFHSILGRYWRCEGHSPHTAAKLRLATHRSLEAEVRFEILFCTNSEGPLIWQEGEVRVMLAETSQPIPRQHRNPALAGPSRPNVVSFALERDPVTSATPANQEQRWEVEGVCQLIQRASSLTSRRLQLLVENDTLWYSTNSFSRNGVRESDAPSLEDLMQPESQFPFAKRKTRFILSVILANALLQLYEGPWLTTVWNKTQICFYPGQDQAKLDLAKPYLSTQCISSHRIEDDQVSARFRVHPYPGILALGILLLELELGVPIEAKRSKDNPNGGREFRNIDADRTVAEKMLEECIDESPEDFIEAVKACLDDRTFTDAFGRDASFDNLKFREQIYTCIVRPLEEALEKVFKIPVERLDTLSSTSGPILNISSGYRRPTSQFSTCTQAAICSAAKLPTGLKEEYPGLKTLQNDQRVSLYFDDSTDVGIADQQHLRKADAWFQCLHTYTHCLIQRDHNGINEPVVEGVFPRSGRTKIAILDTGISFPEEAKDIGYTDRIIDTKSWLGGSVGSVGSDIELNRGDRDLDGHGTHATALLLQVAPDADVYVARVFEGKQDLKGNVMAGEFHKRIAGAIRYATDTWEVDIITMSFGFERSVTIIDEAIKYADSKKIIMLAAASNKGGNGVITWPARLPQVICIYATDSFGNRCDFTPSPSDNADNFSVLGHAVKSFWPPHLKQGFEVPKSGTSTATPIAAGIAALVLQYMRVVLSKRAQIPKSDAEVFSKLRTTAGMSRMFRQMVTNKRDGYDYILPWNFLSVAKYKEASTIYDIVLNDLSNYT